MLFPWARAVVYCKRSGAQMISPKWTNYMRIGPLLRFERYKRYYLNEFSNAGYVGRWRLWFGNIKRFSGMKGFFDSFLSERDCVISELRRIVNPQILECVKRIESEDYIGVHIRRGDFVTNGQWISDAWYITAIQRAVECAGDLPIRIFTDATPRSLKAIVTSFRNIEIMPNAPAIQDLLLLSGSRCIVGTSNSSFSMWAVFLGQQPSIWSDGSVLPQVYVGKSKAIIV